ncbi:MAG: septal ring lytic transglycosylase RlpA family protein [Bacteroidota bacterium]
MKRLFLTLGLAALTIPVVAQQSGPIAPGGLRAEARVDARLGVASYYHPSLHGLQTANGERYDHHQALTVAHRSLPFGTLLRVTSTHNGRRVLVRVNDRGPFIRGRQLDLSGAAADRLRMRQRGVHRVAFEIVDPATLPSRQAPPARKVRHI